MPFFVPLALFGAWSSILRVVSCAPDSVATGSVVPAVCQRCGEQNTTPPPHRTTDQCRWQRPPRTQRSLAQHCKAKLTLSTRCCSLPHCSRCTDRRAPSARRRRIVPLAAPSTLRPANERFKQRRSQTDAAARNREVMRHRPTTTGWSIAAALTMLAACATLLPGAPPLLQPVSAQFGVTTNLTGLIHNATSLRVAVIVNCVNDQLYPDRTPPISIIEDITQCG